MATQTRLSTGSDEDQRHARFDNELDSIRSAVEERIRSLLPAENGSTDLLTQAMRAATLSAGKRMRPLLLMLVARDLDCSTPGLVDVACAVEMVHAASLILDDMPCMDNAMLRRGKPTIHIQFGEDVAILASVALLSRAFSVLSSAEGISPFTRSRLVGTLAETVGAQGLVKGQFLDLRAGARQSPDEIAATNELKTGILLGVAVEMAAVVAQADDSVTRSLRAFALAAGQAFQLRDDFLDGPGNDSAVTGKDTGKDQGKATFINTLGLEEARRRLGAHLRDADRHLLAALGSKQRTRRYLGGLFAQYQPARHARPAPGQLAGRDQASGTRLGARFG